MPKAGTYLVASLLEKLGLENSNLHLGHGEWQDYRGVGKDEALAHPRQYTQQGDINRLLQNAPKGAFFVCHLGPRVVKPPRDMRVLVVLRDIRTASASYLSFARLRRASWEDSTGWRKGACNVEAWDALLAMQPGMIRQFTEVAEWLPHPYIVFFEALIGQWGELAQLEQCSIVARLLNLAPEIVASTLERALASDTLTKSVRPGVTQSFDLHHPALATLNHKLGYQPEDRLARVHLSYAAAPKEACVCPVCTQPAQRRMQSLHDRYGLPVCFSECPTCGHLYQAEQPSSAWWDRFYAEDYWPVYGRWSARSLEEETEASVRRYGQVFHRLRDFGLSPKRILDVGTGTGGVFSAAHDIFPEASVTGSDVFASKRPDVLRIDWQTECRSVSADLITTVHAMEHVRAPREIFENLRASVPDGHLLYVEVPELRVGLGKDRNFFHLAHVQYFEEPILRQLLEECGYSHIKTFRGHIPEWPWTMGLLFRADEARNIAQARRRWIGWKLRRGRALRLCYWNAYHLAHELKRHSLNRFSSVLQRIARDKSS